MNPTRIGPTSAPHDNRVERPAIAKRVLHLFAEDDEDLLHGQSCRRLVFEPRQRHERILEIVVTGLRSQLVRRARRRRLFPRAITMIESHNAETSCITWLENSTQRPSARSRRMMSRTARVLITSSPLVGSSSRTLLRVMDQRARERHLGPLAMREALRPPIRDLAHVERLHQRCMRISSSLARQTRAAARSTRCARAA